MNRPLTLRTLLITNGLTVLLFVAVLLVSSTAAHPMLRAATVSSQTTTINYQGHLTDNAGEPVNGTLPMTFKLYRDPSGGTAVWTEQRSGSNAVPVTDGLFSVALGSVTPIDISLFGEPLWLGISVNGDAEMSPREPFAGVPYAAVAGTVPDGSISSDKLGLQYGTQCLSNDISLNSSGEVPGLKLDFSLERPSLVLISLEGTADVDPAPTSNNYYQMSLRLDNERETISPTWFGKWFNFDTQRIMHLDAGLHTLSAEAYMGISTGVINLYGPDTIYRNRLCINYVVLGDQ